MTIQYRISLKDSHVLLRRIYESVCGQPNQTLFLKSLNVNVPYPYMLLTARVILQQVTCKMAYMSNLVS